MSTFGRIGKISLTTGWLPVSLFTLTVLCLLSVLILSSSKSRWKPLLTQALIGLAGGLVGWLLVWFLSDVLLVFGVSLGWVVELIVAFGFGFLSFLIAAFIQSSGMRRIMALVTSALMLLSCALGIDMVYGEYTTLGSMLGIPAHQELDPDMVGSAGMSIQKWRLQTQNGKLSNMPSRGIVRSVAIPATASSFQARNADIYLPPAALGSTSPKLPVMIMMAGQPGSPDRFFGASLIAQMLDSYAKLHDGLAPIVVSPDQNGTITHNSLCADTLIHGKAETYLTVDVTHWIKSNLPVEQASKYWLIGGFSQGGTCSTQLGPAHPDLYGHIFSAAGEVEPVDHSVDKTIKRYFHADRKAYEKHVPANIIARHAPSRQTWFSIAGSWDQKSQKNQAVNSKAALDAGMTVVTLLSKDSGHNWRTVQTGLLPQIDRFGEETGLSTTHRQLSSYPRVEVIHQD